MLTRANQVVSFYDGTCVHGLTTVEQASAGDLIDSCFEYEVGVYHSIQQLNANHVDDTSREEIELGEVTRCMIMVKGVAWYER